MVHIELPAEYSYVRRRRLRRAGAAAECNLRSSVPASSPCSPSSTWASRHVLKCRLVWFSAVKRLPPCSQVGSARRESGVPYPYLYADQAEAEKDKKKYVFNCVQRGACQYGSEYGSDQFAVFFPLLVADIGALATAGHQNALESHYQILMMLFIGGLKHPVRLGLGSAPRLTLDPPRRSPRPLPASSGPSAASFMAAAMPLATPRSASRCVRPCLAPLAVIIIYCCLEQRQGAD